ncbi:MFS transporter [Peribacillus simplex]|uniref:MFS transporter n=1 Tax=Peribacillus simplex TaxID=1478 RepID=A0A8B5Y2L9_9BACI|nr:MFS transporter [Peribacillus simplex]MED3909794.1 MFS transporter [Peribacillus simplex]TVX82994.1 MFS transporter [Peribacillus simplex]
MKLKWIVLAFLSVLYLINFTDKAIIGYAAIPIMEDLDLNYSQWGIVGSSFFWFFSIMSIVGAALSDRIGTGKMLAFMAIGLTIVQFGALTIYGLPMLILSRVLLGAIEGPFHATAISHISKHFVPEQRGLAISIMNTGSMIAKFMVPLLIYMIGIYGWRMVLVFLGVLSMVWAVLWILTLKGENKRNIVKSESTLVSEKVKWSEIYPLFLSSTFIFTCLALFMAYWILTWSFIWMPTYLVKIVHLTQTQMGYAVMFIGLGSALGGILISFISDRLLKKTKNLRQSRVLVAGPSLILASVCFYSTTFVQSTIGAIIALFLGMAFVNGMFPLAPQIVNHLLPERRGLMSGVLLGIANLSGIIGPAVIGFVVQSAGENIRVGFNYSVLLTATLLLMASLIFCIFTKPDNHTKKSPLSPEVVNL